LINNIKKYNMNLDRKCNAGKQLKNEFIRILIFGLLFVSFPLTLKAFAGTDKVQVFNVLQYGAIGDGKTLDTKAIQEAIDKASSTNNQTRVLIPTGHKFLIGTVYLKSNIDFCLEGNSELMVSTNRNDYSGEAAVMAQGANNLKISGSGTINGRALEFMSHFEAANGWWIPKDWRPKLFILTSCKNLDIRDITIEKAPLWSLHMLGCEHVLIDNIKIKNNLDVPNCDGIDPDHCRNVEIRNCSILCGDDAIVVKTTRQEQDYGPSANIWVHNCTLETQDSGLKIGTETTQDIFNVVFEKCNIKTSSRGLTIQLRDEGNVFNVMFKDITFVSKYYSNPWWGRGEAISFTSIPRNPGTKIGTIHDIHVQDIQGLAENSVRINGTKESRINNVSFNKVNITMNRSTSFAGGLFDNRPTKAYEGIEIHGNPGYYVCFADNVNITGCSIQWGKIIPDYFTHAIEAHDVTGLTIEKFDGEAAHPERDKAIVTP
jgi:polygalacturonase